MKEENKMNSNELSEFQYVVKDDIWNVVSFRLILLKEE